MYTAKRRGKNRSEIFEDGMHHAAVERLDLEADLRRALQRGELVVHYQPIVALPAATITGVEALVRWQHPERGLVPPDAFIPVAETTALIHALTARVLTLAIAQARAWQLSGLHIPVAVNLSARCLTDLTLPDRVLGLLADHGLPTALLHLEVTESAVMADPQRAMAVLQTLHDAGIQLSLDDFGTGHSSMSYLRQLPVEELKIDKSFVKEIVTNKSDGILVRSIIDLAHNLGLCVVAEGVEDEEALTLLRELGCDIAQGYHLGRPVPAAALDLRLASAGPETPTRELAPSS
jgi:EAL domain-containing protein (putative c-di-GMP-specific phosphodiesterase class I)